MISVFDDVWDGNSKSNSDLHHVIGKCLSAVQQTRISENVRIPALHYVHWYGATSALALLGMVGQGKIDKWKGRMAKSNRIEWKTFSYLLSSVRPNAVAEWKRGK